MFNGLRINPKLPPSWEACPRQNIIAGDRRERNALGGLDGNPLASERCIGGKAKPLRRP